MQDRQLGPPHQRKFFSDVALFSILAGLTSFPPMREATTPSPVPGLMAPKALAAYEDRWTDRHTHRAAVDVLRIKEDT